MKKIFPLMRPVRGVLGEGNDGEDRRGAVRAGGASGWLCLLCKCNNPVLHTRSKVNDGETIVPLCFERRGSGTGVTKCKTLAKTNEFTLATTQTQATQKSAARPNRAPPRDQAERYKTSTEHRPC